jgi:hypothetical protein
MAKISEVTNIPMLTEKPLLQIQKPSATEAVP